MSTIQVLSVGVQIREARKGALTQLGEGHEGKMPKGEDVYMETGLM